MHPLEDQALFAVLQCDTNLKQKGSQDPPEEVFSEDLTTHAIPLGYALAQWLKQSWKKTHNKGELGKEELHSS